MPFGLASAVHTMTKLFKPITAYLGSKGIRHTIFIDNGRVLARSESDARDSYKVTMNVLEKAGRHREHRSQTNGRKEGTAKERDC